MCSWVTQLASTKARLANCAEATHRAITLFSLTYQKQRDKDQSLNKQNEDNWISLFRSVELDTDGKKPT